MSQIEVVITGYSIIIALCVARLLDALRPAVFSGIGYWIHQVWIANLLLAAMLLFWSTWTLFDSQTISFAQFVSLTTGPGILYMQVTALVTRFSEEVEDWRRHYYEVRKFYFAAWVAFHLVTLFNLHVVAGAQFPTRASVVLILNGTLCAFCVLSDNPRLHAVVVLVVLIAQGLGIAANVAAATGL